MDNEDIKYYDLQSLLKINNLDARLFAENHTITAKAYFLILDGLLASAHNTDGALAKFEKREGDIDAYRSLDDMILLLKKLECGAYVTELYSILGAYETGNWRLAAYHAEKIKEDIARLCAQVAAAKRTAEKLPGPGLELNFIEYIEKLESKEEKRIPAVLAVDDSPVVLRSVSSVLNGIYKVYTLPKPAMLEEALKRITPELFLLDYKMPDINGFELIPVIRSYAEHKDTPIVFLTSEGTVDTVKSALALGACDFIVKPFVPDELRSKIAKWIVKKQ